MRRLLALLIAAQLALVGTAPAFGQEYAFPPASTGGGGGTGCVPSGSAGSLLTDDGAGACTSNTTGTGVVTALGVNTGSAGSVVLNGGALGTPSSGTLTNATGLPISTGVSGLGTGVATFLGTASSANLASALADETGTGSVVFSASPTFTGTITAAAANFSGNITAANLTPSGTLTNGNLCYYNSTTLDCTIAQVSVGQGGTGLASGTSGGIPYFSGSTTIASSGALTANLPVIGGGAGAAPTVGTRQGNTTAFVTYSGSAPSTNDCAKFDASGNLTTAGAACGGGSSAFSGITSGTNTSATMTVGTGGSITTSGSGTVNANQFKGNAAVAVADGGTGSTTALAAARALGFPYLVGKVTNPVTVGATTAETTVFTATLPVLTANDMIRCTFQITLNSDSDTKTILWKLDGTTVLTYTPTTAFGAGFSGTIHIANQNSVSSQNWWGWYNDTNANGRIQSATTSSINTGTSKNLTITMQKQSTGNTMVLQGIACHLISDGT